MRVRVNKDHCTGHGQCEIHGPDVFALDELGHSGAIVGEIPDELVEQAHAGAAACPERAITVTP